jgi:hypothetical protein
MGDSGVIGWALAHAAGGLLAFAAPRFLIALGVPYDRWIIGMGERVKVHLNREAVIWAVTVLLGLALYAGSVALSEDYNWDPQVPEGFLRALAMVRPTHVIILALVIALFGAVWQLRANPAVATPLISTGDPLRDAIRAYLVKHGNSISRADDVSIHTGGDSTGDRSPYIVYWNSDVLGPWPTTSDGFTASQVRRFPNKIPKFTLQYDKEKFRDAVEDFSKVINDRVSAIGTLSNNVAGMKPLVAKGRGRGAIDPLEKLQQVSAIQKEVDSRLFAGGNGPFFDQYPRYKEELLGLMPEESQNVWVAYNGALYRFTNALMVVRQAEKHPEDGELFEYTMKDLDHIQDEFVRAAGDIRRWVELVNTRIDLMVKAI